MTQLNEAERVARAERAARAMEEFFDPALRHVQSVFSNRLKEICSTTPWEAGKITALANVLRITEELGADIESLIYDGEHARKDMIRVEKYEKMTPSKRRLINI